jgi:ElaB/YqjD/DUF883 family membrane-anchored ribosome-binding protein
MTHNVHEATKDTLRQDFNAAISETEHLLQSVASSGGEKAAALRASVEQSLETARLRLRNLQQAAVDATSAAARATDEYVHENPWQTIGVAAGLGTALGVVIGMLVSRR